MKEQVVLITGVNRGFGFELTREYCRMDWHVFGVLRSKRDSVLLSSEFGKVFTPVIVDLRDASAEKDIRLSLERNTDSLSLLINNAGIGGIGHCIEKTSCSEIKEIFDVHCCGVIRCLKAALPFLKKAESPTVVNVSSRVGSISKVSDGHLDHIPLSYGIRMAKAAQNMLSASLYRELRETGIAVFAVHPGKIRTRMGSPDADMPAVEAARRFVSWLPKIRLEREFGYFKVGAEELPF